MPKTLLIPSFLYQRIDGIKRQCLENPFKKQFNASVSITVWGDEKRERRALSLRLLPIKSNSLLIKTVFI